MSISTMGLLLVAMTLVIDAATLEFTELRMLSLS